jgi:flagellar hook-length control protein FliK
MLQPIEEWPLHQTVPKHANWELPAIEPDSPQKKETVVPAAIVSSEGGLSSRPVRHSAPETVTTPTLVTQFPEVMATHARMISHHGGPHEFQLRLDPPDLGEVNVRLIAAGDRIQAEVLVGNDAVRRMIESQLPDLRQRLEAAGLQLSNCDVNTQSDHGRSERSLWEQIAQEVIPSRVRPAPTPKWRENSIPRSGLLDVTA